MLDRYTEKEKHYQKNTEQERRLRKDNKSPLSKKTVSCLPKASWKFHFWTEHFWENVLGKLCNNRKKNSCKIVSRHCSWLQALERLGAAKRRKHVFSALTLNLSQFRCCDNLKRAVPSKQPINIETLNRLVRWIDQKPYKQQQQHKFGEDFIAKAGSTCSLTFSTLYREWLLGVFSVTMYFCGIRLIRLCLWAKLSPHFMSNQRKIHKPIGFWHHWPYIQHV